MNASTRWVWTAEPTVLIAGQWELVLVLASGTHRSLLLFKFFLLLKIVETSPVGLAFNPSSLALGQGRVSVLTEPLSLAVLAEHAGGACFT